MGLVRPLTMAFSGTSAAFLTKNSVFLPFSWMSFLGRFISGTVSEWLLVAE